MPVKGTILHTKKSSSLVSQPCKTSINLAALRTRNSSKNTHKRLKMVKDLFIILMIFTSRVKTRHRPCSENIFWRKSQIYEYLSEQATRSNFKEHSHSLTKINDSLEGRNGAMTLLLHCFLILGSQHDLLQNGLRREMSVLNCFGNFTPLLTMPRFGSCTPLNYILLHVLA